MITFEDAMIAKDDPEVSGISPANLDAQDMVNLILQRSEIIRDQNNHHRFIKAWTKGDNDPLLGLVEHLGTEELVRRAAAFIYLEYMQIRPYLGSIKPSRIADIGCGYAFFPMFLAREFGTKLFLIDLETNTNRHFGFEQEGAAYSNLAHTRDFLSANAVPKADIDLRNPEIDDLTDIKDLDYIFSFISCGFHYPWDTYLRFYQDALRDDGRIILDLRARKFADALPEISKFGFARHLTKAAYGSADRVMIVKAV